MMKLTSRQERKDRKMSGGAVWGVKVVQWPSQLQASRADYVEPEPEEAQAA